MFAGVLVGVRGGRGVRGPPLGLRSYGIVGERLKESTDRRRAALSESCELIRLGGRGRRGRGEK